MNPQPQKVFVGLSGGVDSSVSAALLTRAGYDVTGVFIRAWTPDSSRSGLESGKRPDLLERLNLASGKRFNLGDLFGECSVKEDRLDAMRVCAKLSIPFVELDLEKEYKKEVVDYMIREYRAGRTPNPDVFCNRFIKFGAFYEWAMRQGADFVATGHYARIIKHKTWNMGHERSQSSCFMLHASCDTAKDQSYFLWQIRKEQLPHILFPVGGMRKSEVRKLAKKFGLPTAEKKDSQGLCFLGKVDMKEFLSHYIKPKRGKVLNEKGEAIGEHDGAFFYTLGERIGSRLSLKSEERFNPVAPKPLYIISKDMARNALTVSHKSPAGELPRAASEVSLMDRNWFVAPRAGKRYGARVRYRQPLQGCRLGLVGGRTSSPKRGSTSKGAINIAFEVPQIAAAGQSAVVYDGEVCLGGGVIR